MTTELFKLWQEVNNDENVTVEEADAEHMAPLLEEFAKRLQYRAPNYQTLQDLCKEREDLEASPMAASGPGCFHPDFVDSDSETVGELLNTGSVTVTLGFPIQQWVISLHAEKERS